MSICILIVPNSVHWAVILCQSVIEILWLLILLCPFYLLQDNKKILHTWNSRFVPVDFIDLMAVASDFQLVDICGFILNADWIILLLSCIHWWVCICISSALVGKLVWLSNMKMVKPLLLVICTWLFLKLTLPWNDENG